MMKPFHKTVLAMGVAAMTLAGCNLSGGSAATTGSGTLSLDITDAPVDSATEVTVIFSGVDIQSANGVRTEIRYDESKAIDLLSLQGGITEPLLEEETLPAGDYEWIRLVLDADLDSASYIVIDEAQYDLFIPSGAQTGLKLVSGFTIPVNGEVSMTIDFDLRKSIVAPKGNPKANYFLKPALRLVDNSEVGHIAGVIASTTLTGNCSGAVYVYEGFDVEPGDVGGDGNEPLTSAMVDTDQTGVDEFEYKVAFLVAGEYTASFTCDADLDDPEEADDLVFIGTQNVVVEAGDTASADF
ncbi:MAG: DUF4382 domain-containing protein [Saccharospirillum sp.]|nr:DUF4382 domain-containing protein [Saccharospirillum sp.]